VERIQLRTERKNGKQVVYGLFVDFSSVYNTILHSKLFERAVELWGQLNNIVFYKSHVNCRTGTHERRIERKMTINKRSEVNRNFLQIVTLFLNENHAKVM